jgi:multimeric flavodoxin WrbA
MKIAAFLGSPDKSGNSTAFAKVIGTEAGKKGHQVEYFYLYDRKFQGCIGCGKCKTGEVEFCTQNDDMLDMIHSIVDSDCVILSSPVYFGHLTGPAKCFVDRWCTFFDGQFVPRHVTGKKFIGILACGAPAETYNELMGYFQSVFGDFFKMEIVEKVIMGDMMGENTFASHPELLERATAIGRSL